MDEFMVLGHILTALPVETPSQPSWQRRPDRHLRGHPPPLPKGYVPTDR